jgi:hypothetical protein
MDFIGGTVRQQCFIFACQFHWVDIASKISGGKSKIFAAWPLCGFALKRSSV